VAAAAPIPAAEPVTNGQKKRGGTAASKAPFGSPPPAAPQVKAAIFVACSSLMK
jgi:hypothetical protein